jgi:hypothetical protein
MGVRRVSDYKMKFDGKEMKFCVEVNEDKIKQNLKEIALPNVEILRGVKNSDDAFYEWIIEAIPKDPVSKKWLCAGARVNIDADGRTTFTIDAELPDGVWIVTYPTKTYRLEGVTGPHKRK